MTERKLVELLDLYFAPGIDLNVFLSQLSPIQALRAQASMLRWAAEHIESVVTTLDNDPNVDIVADNHYIGIYAPTDKADMLLQQELVSEPLNESTSAPIFSRTEDDDESFDDDEFEEANEFDSVWRPSPKMDWN